MTRYKKQFLSNLNFDTWLRNHSNDHYAKWCRELYPYSIFNLIDFSEHALHKKQRLWYNFITYRAEILCIEMQENGRFCSEFSLNYNNVSKGIGWNNRLWNETFKIIYTDKFEFITVFTSKNDPSKIIVSNFMKGKFLAIEKNKSKPLSDLLFRTLIAHMCKEKFIGGTHARTYDILNSGHRKLPSHPEIDIRYISYTPIYSMERELWIAYSFSEERAHREAIAIANQCNELIVVYIKPTYTRHHRCKFENTQVVSAFEFWSSLNINLRSKYDKQIRFLQNHLNSDTPIDLILLRKQIDDPETNAVEISKPDLLEAFSVMKIPPGSEKDIFYKLAAFNLINYWASKQRKKDVIENEQDDLFRNIYYFKGYLSNFVTDLIKQRRLHIKIYINMNLLLIEVNKFQFSFHNVPKNNVIDEYEKSEDNIEIEWCGKRLQPVASLIFKLSKALNTKP
ncbi:hypothetical protein [Dyadobacter aurulentus]|uniref:hypothetical protein n=1 Tax=Dyadobacter sp. UC 10 TaxID=2605428 RepID=UPI0011F17D73|nr:hypothetical protein [Dyadobacter sp. UC 10]KAA0993516.1 hypothetical protein FXO21_26720 [Dyadobacter sp. UC 10]